jgi:sulfur-oxidizing protein SoxZ
MRVKASARNGKVLVKALMQHPMETGRRKDSDGNLVPGHYITEVEAIHNGERVFHAELGPAVSKDPYVAFSFSGGASGDTFSMSWVDNTGATESVDVDVR